MPHVRLKWYQWTALRIALGVAGLALCSAGVGMLVNAEAASGAEGGAVKRLLQPMPAGQMAWWSAALVLLGFAVLANATRWLDHRPLACAQAAFFFVATAVAVGLWVWRLAALAGGAGQPGLAVFGAMVAGVCLLSLLRAMGLAWRWGRAERTGRRRAGETGKRGRGQGDPAKRAGA